MAKMFVNSFFKQNTNNRIINYFDNGLKCLITIYKYIYNINISIFLIYFKSRRVRQYNIVLMLPIFCCTKFDEILFNTK